MKKFLSGIFLFLLIISGFTYVHADSRYITEFASVFYIPAVAVPVGGSPSGILEQLKDITVQAYTGTDEDLDLTVDWDFSQIDFSRRGAYEITGHPHLPEGYVLADNCTLPAYIASISVQNYDSPDINACSLMKAAGLFVFPWLPVTDEDQIQIFLKRESSSWINLTDMGYAFCDTDALYLPNSAMTPGNTYQLALTYKNEPDKILKFYYKSDRTLELSAYGTGSISDDLFQPSTIIKSIEEFDVRTIDRYMAFAVPCGGSLTEVTQELDSVSYGILGSTSETYEDSAENPARHLLLTWDYSNVNLNIPGVYTVIGSLSAPEGYTFAPELTLPHYTVYISVQNPLQPEINAYYMPARDFFCFPLCLDAFSSGQIAGFKIWYKKDTASYVPLPEESGFISGNEFILERFFLQENSSYSFYISWENGRTGTFSFTYDHAFITNDQWMERNYADRNQQTVPDYTQIEEVSPTVTPAADTSGIYSRTEDIQESVTDKWTVISGRRLGILLADAKEKISFEKNGISTVLPVSLVKEWEIGEDETLQIYTQQDEDTVSIHIYKGDQEITDIPGAYIQLGGAASDTAESVSVTDSTGEELSVSKDTDQNIITVKTDQTGDFTIDSPKKQATNRAGMLFILLIIGIGAVFKVSSGKRGV